MTIQLTAGFLVLFRIRTIARLLTFLFAELLLTSRTRSSTQTLRTVLTFFLAVRATSRIGTNEFFAASRASKNLSHDSPSAFVASHIVPTLGASRMRVSKDFKSTRFVTVTAFKAFLVLSLLEEATDLLAEVGVSLGEHLGAWLHRCEKFEIQVRESRFRRGLRRRMCGMRWLGAMRGTSLEGPHALVVRPRRFVECGRTGPGLTTGVRSRNTGREVGRLSLTYHPRGLLV